MAGTYFIGRTRLSRPIYHTNRCRRYFVPATQPPDPIYSQPAVQIRKRPDHFSDCSFCFRRCGADNRCRNVELRYTVTRHADRSGTEGHFSKTEWTFSWSASPEVRGHTSERPAVSAHINIESGDRRRGHRDLVGRYEGIRRRPILRSSVGGIARRPKPNHWTHIIHRLPGSTKQTDRAEGGRSDTCVAAVL